MMSSTNMYKEIDRDKLAEVALAILSLTLHDNGRVWKGLDWDLMGLLHEKGWIMDPRSRAKSVVLTEEGERLAPELLHRHLGRAGGATSSTLGRSSQAVPALLDRRSGERPHSGIEGSRSGVVLYAKDVRRMAAFYSAVLGFQESGGDDNHAVLESPGSQLVILGIPRDIASSIEITTPPTRRDKAAIKPVFFVESIAAVRTAAETRGGVLNSAEKEWSFQGFTVCDGLDPEGNVLQFRESAG